VSRRLGSIDLFDILQLAGLARGRMKAAELLRQDGTQRRKDPRGRSCNSAALIWLRSGVDKPVCIRQPRSLQGAALKHVEQVSENHVPGLHPRARLEPKPSRVQPEHQELNHRRERYPISCGGYAG
jgi:hypothetical protein